MTIGEKAERTCPESTSEVLQLPAITSQNTMVNISHHISTSGLTRLTQIKGRNESLDANRILSPSVMGTLPPIVGRSDTYVNRPLSASGLKKLPPIKSTSKTTEMERPMSSARLSPFTAFENTENRPLSACGSPKLPPIIDGNPLEMCRPTSSLFGNLCNSASLDKSEMSDHQYDVKFDDMVVDQDYQDEEMFSQHLLSSSVYIKHSSEQNDVSIKKRAIEKEEKEDYEENILYAEEIKASLKTKIKSNLRILDNFIREKEEKEKAKSILKQVNTENADEAIYGTLNEKNRADEEKIVLQPDQTGSCYENTDGSNEVGYEKKMNTTFEIIEEIKASLKGFDKNKIKSNLRILDNLIREEEEKENAKSELKQVHTENNNQAAVDVTGNDKIRDTKEKIVLSPDQIGSCYEDTDGTNEVGYEKEINTCFDIIFEKPKKRMSKPKLSSENRKPAQPDA
ncbi:unnamed protein product [Mytilus edulis]|uniref:Uncharacterized protein n=1 Tax=Mytilus edulis TaxID=6550 RepID=A0A8S3R514_MYTED|nr:unnamed protein product [Mytilus edulis]